MSGIVSSVAVLVMLVICRPCTAQLGADQSPPETRSTSQRMHELLARDAGNWRCDTTRFMGPETAKEEGHVTFRMIMGGRFQQSTHSGVFMGRPTEGMGLDGYDDATKEFHSVWIDTFGDAIIFLRGTWDEKRKVVTYTGSIADPERHRQLGLRGTTDYNDPNTRVYEAFLNLNGKEAQSLRSVCTREK